MWWISSTSVFEAQGIWVKGDVLDRVEDERAWPRSTPPLAPRRNHPTRPTVQCIDYLGKRAYHRLDA
jgi:hypothetical protein